ncbi:MAG: sodium/solute symporter, partial [Gammaproteobacteria bacterium]
MVETNYTIILTFAAYLAVVLVVGAVAWRRTKNLKDYILGGRRLGRWVTAISAQASDMSGWLLMGLPGYAYAAGMESIWLLVGLLIGTYANWKFTAARLRVATERYGDSLTLPDYLDRRFNDRSGVLRLLSALFILVFFTFYTSSGLVAGGRLFEEVFGLDYFWAVAAGGVTIVVYTFIGGFLAVSWTDLIQGLLMFAALIIVAVMGLAAIGGLDGMASGMATVDPALLDPFTNAAGEPLGAIAVISLLGWGLGYFGQPHILARFMAASSVERIRDSRRIAMTWVTVALACGMVVGMCGIALLDEPLAG